MRRRNRLLALAAVLLWLLWIPTAAAVENGSLEVTDVTKGVQLYQILDQQGKLTEDFSGAEDLLQEVRTDPVSTARQLAVYASERNCKSAETAPDAAGKVFYPSLSLGMYLVCSSDGEFSPFLLEIPTVINGNQVYQMKAKPKVDDEPEKPVPPDTQPTVPENTGTTIPQTGISVIPKYTLMGLGTVITLWGLWEMLRGREDAV